MLPPRCQNGRICWPCIRMGDNEVMLNTGSLRLRATKCMDRILEGWIGWSHPPLGVEPVDLDPWMDWCVRCGASVPTTRSDHASGMMGCSACRSEFTPFDGVVRLGRWDGRLRELIIGLKYQRWWEVAEPLGRLLALRIKPLLHESISPVVIVPVPMPRMRRWHRGIDHARLLARCMSRYVQCPMACPLIMRRCPPQVSASRSQRERAPLNRVQLRPRGSKCRFQGNFRGRTIVLVDDVRTTGRTAAAAARQLRRLGPSRLYLAVAAVSDGESEQGSNLT